MTRKKKIVIWIVVIAALLGGFLAFRIPSWTRTYGLSQEVLAGDRAPTAEETIRLYFYYCNRQNGEKVQQILGAKCEDVISESYFEDLKILGALKLLEIQDSGAWETPEEIGAFYQVRDYYVTYNQSLLYASSRETAGSECYRFILAQERQDGPWMIYSIGDG